MTIDRQGQLRGEQAILDANVVTAAFQFTRKVAFAPHQF